MKQLANVLFLLLILVLVGWGLGIANATQQDSLPGVWQRSNPGGGGAFLDVGAGPTGVVLVGSDLSGAYRSLDNGLSWDNIGGFRGLRTTHVGTVGFDVVDADILYLGTEHGIYRSTDQGDTVTRVLDNGYIEAITFSKSEPTIGYATHHPAYNATNATVYKTTDRGQTWGQISNGTLPDDLRLIKLIVDPTDSSRLYVLGGDMRFACGPAVLYESADSGTNWTRLAANVGQVMDVVLDPNDATKLYLSTYGDVWDAGFDCVVDDDDGGYLYRGDLANDNWTWTQITDGSNLKRLNARLWIEHDDSTLHIIDIDWPEHFESVDGGATWTKLGDKGDWPIGWPEENRSYGGSFNGNAKTFDTTPTDPHTLFWVDGQRVYSTTDAGRTFAPNHTLFSNNGWQSTGVDNSIMFDIAISSADSNDIYLAYADMGCFRSHNGGAGWLSCNDPAYTGSWGIAGGNNMAIVTDPTQDGVLWTTSARKITWNVHTLIASADHGETWQTVKAFPSNDIPSDIMVDPASDVANRTLYAAVAGDIWRGNSDGTDWMAIFDCNGCRYLAMQTYGTATTLFAGGEAGLWRSVDGGDTWADVGGADMQGFGTGFWNRNWSGVADIVVDPHNADVVYATVYGEDKGLYRSLNQGADGSWQQILTDDYLKRVVVHPNDANVVLATSASNLYSGGFRDASSGVWYSNNAYAANPAWEQVNHGLSWAFANPITFDPNDANLLWVGSPGTGFHYRNIGVPASIELQIVGSNVVNSAWLIALPVGLLLFTTAVLIRKRPSH